MEEKLLDLSKWQECFVKKYNCYVRSQALKGSKLDLGIAYTQQRAAVFVASMYSFSENVLAAKMLPHVWHQEQLHEKLCAMPYKLQSTKGEKFPSPGYSSPRTKNLPPLYMYFRKSL